MARMNLETAMGIITNDGSVTINREEHGWVARYSSNNHVIRRFTSGYDLTHCAMFMTEKSVPAKEACKGDEYRDWWDERQANNAKVGGTAHNMWYKARLDLVESLLALNTYDEVKDKLMEVRNECANAMIYQTERTA